MKQYRISSSALTGRAPRTLSAAFGCHHSDPVHPMPDGSRSWLESVGCAAVAVACLAGRLLARLFGR